MANENKDYYVKKVESQEQVQSNPDTKIAGNVVFAAAGLLLAGVAFGIGEEVFNSTTIQYIAAFGGVGITSTNLKAMREKLKLKATLKENNAKQYTKGRK